MTIDTTSLAKLLEALRTWLTGNPQGDLQEFADQQGCTVEDLTDAWYTYFSQYGDFSRNYNLDTTQAGVQSGVASSGPSPVYSPAPPPKGATPAQYREYLLQEVHNYQQFITVNNIEDNSFNQQILNVGGTINQDIDIDNSDNVTGDDGVIIRDSNLTDTKINTGDIGQGGVLQQGDGDVANTGDVSASDGSASSVFGSASSVGSGNDFGAGAQGAVNAAQGDGNKQANQQQHNDTDITVGNTTGGAGGAGTGGAGGKGGIAHADAMGGDGGGGLAGGAGGSAHADADAYGGLGTGGTGGSSAVEVDADSTQVIDFG